MTQMNRLLSLCALFLAVSCGCDSRKSELSETDQLVTDSLIIEMAGIEGKSVFEISDDNHELDYVESSMGVFVKGIDSISSNRSYIWLISVNDTMITTSIDKYIARDSDIIKWHYRKLE